MGFFMEKSISSDIRVGLHDKYSYIYTGRYKRDSEPCIVQTGVSTTLGKCSEIGIKCGPIFIKPHCLVRVIWYVGTYSYGVLITMNLPLLKKHNRLTDNGFALSLIHI